MSVAPGSMWNLPHHRRPRGMGRGSTGPDSDRVFGIERSPLAEARLAVRSDPVRPDKHAFVEPVERVSLHDYESALASTRSSWECARP